MALYEFKLPPFSSLTDGQKIAVNLTEPIALSGGPGTGKSVVSVWRHLYNCDNNRKSLLLTYTKTLSKSLELICRTQGNSKAAAAVGRTQQFYYNIGSKPYYDEIIVDEAQDMPLDFYNELQKKAKVISYGADDSQILYKDKCSTQRELGEIFESNEPAELDRNFRNSYEIMSLVKSLFPRRNVPLSLMNDLLKDSSKRGPKPIFYFTTVGKYDHTNNIQDGFIKDIITEFHNDGHNIAILVPFQSMIETFVRCVTAAKFVCSSYKSDDDDIHDIKNIHVTTLKSSKGLEFDTVIIPNFHKVTEDLARFNVDDNDFFVAVTRARRNLFLLSNRKINHLDLNTYQTEMPTVQTNQSKAILEDDDLPF